MAAFAAAAARRQQGPEAAALAERFGTCCQWLVRVCNFQPKVSNQKHLSWSGDFSGSHRVFPLAVALPLLRHLTVTLPPDGRVRPGHNPFPLAAPTLAGVEDKMDVLSSLQRPKKITLRASDGKGFAFLAKPKDDLRKDTRMMEFVSGVNRLLQREPAPARRKLYLRAFAVVPLTEDCGIIEWVPNTVGLRHVLTDLYTLANRFKKTTTNPHILKIYTDGMVRDRRPPADVLRQVGETPLWGKPLLPPEDPFLCLPAFKIPSRAQRTDSGVCAAGS